jgi:hypothetical protein
MPEQLSIVLLENDDNDVELIQSVLTKSLPQYTIEYKSLRNQTRFQCNSSNV